MTTDERIVIALDPGVTTGVAIVENEQYEFAQLDGNLHDMYEYLYDVSPDEVAYEEFQYRPEQKHALLYSAEVIGVIKCYCQDKYINDKYKYPPSRTMKFWTDAKLKKLGLWQPGLGHAMDALRVLLAHRAATDPSWYQQILEQLK